MEAAWVTVMCGCSPEVPEHCAYGWGRSRAITKHPGATIQARGCGGGREGDGGPGPTGTPILVVSLALLQGGAELFPAAAWGIRCITRVPLASPA
jgi:hypothetical protein